MDNLLLQIAHCVERGKMNMKSPHPADLKGQPGVDELTSEAISQGIAPADVLNQGLIAGMEAIGVKFRENKVFVPEVLIAARAMNAGMKHIAPFFEAKVLSLKGIVVVGTVAGDLHDIGKNILAMMLKGSGWDVIDLGVDVSGEKFADAVKTHKPDAVCLSALLTTTMLNMKTIRDIVKAVDPDVKVLVGGAPVTARYAEEIAADLYSPDPQGAIEFLNKHCLRTVN